jgi:hypothetical protein
MIKHEKKLSANPEADQLWREFDHSLDEGSVTEEQISKALDDKNIQCLNYRALAVIIGKIQVALGAMEMRQTQSPNGKLQVLHAKLQVLGGTMFPYLAVRLKQSSRTLLENFIDECRVPTHEEASGAASPEEQAARDEARDPDEASVTGAGSRNRGRRGQG